MPLLIANKFTFPNTVQSLFASLRQVLDFVSIHLPAYADAAAVNFKLKVIITELLNNSVKHAGGSDITINLSIDNERILLEKTDNGNRFMPPNLPVLFEESICKKIKLSSDSLHALFALIESEKQLRFLYEEETDQPADLNGLVEHFGLLIITKSADEFVYQYDKSTALNAFKVRVDLT